MFSRWKSKGAAKVCVYAVRVNRRYTVTDPIVRVHRTCRAVRTTGVLNWRQNRFWAQWRRARSACKSRPDGRRPFADFVLFGRRRRTDYVRHRCSKYVLYAYYIRVLITCNIWGSTSHPDPYWNTVIVVFSYFFIIHKEFQTYIFSNFIQKTRESNLKLRISMCIGADVAIYCIW